MPGLRRPGRLRRLRIHGDAAENGSAADTDLAPRAETTYEISQETYNAVFQKATDSSETDITFVLTGKVTTSFAGISGKHITLTSQGDSPWSINPGL